MLVAKLIFPTCRRSFWFLCCCLLLTNEFIAHAVLTPLNGLEHVSPARQMSNTNQQKESKCFEWQVLKGDECTCAESAAVACKDASGGIVCDNYGNQYPSVCHFLVQMCNGEISTRHELDTCGTCTALRLLNSSVLPLGSESFVLTNGGDQKAKYESEDNKDLTIYYEEKLNKWILGKKKDKQDMLLAMFADPSTFVQDSQEGAFVVRQNLSKIQQENANSGKLLNFETLFEYDPHIHLDCINNQDVRYCKNRTVPVKYRMTGSYVHSYLSWHWLSRLTSLVFVMQQVKFTETGTKKENSRQSRAIFTLIAIGIGLAAAATTTTLTAVQHTKGCLYYPSVCSMRDEIKHTLRPRLSQLHNDFTNKFGSGDSFHKELVNTKYTLEEIKAHLTRINQLQRILDSNLENTVNDAKLFDGLISIPFDTSLIEIQNFDKLVKRTLIAESIGLGLTVIESSITAGIAIFGTVSTALSVATAVFAVLGVILGAVAIAISAVEERKLRDKLRTSKHELQNAISKMERAWANIAEIQRNLNHNVVNPIRTFAKNVYDLTGENTFYGLYSFLTHSYSGSNSIDLNLNHNVVNPIRTFAKNVYDLLTHSYSGSNSIDLNWLIRLQNHLQKVLEYTSNSIRKLQTAIFKHEKLRRYRVTIRNQVESFQSPSSILSALQNVPTPELFRERLSSIPLLLHYISRKILPTAPCFMGYDLTSARRCKSCYDNNKICDVPQLSTDKQTIQRLITEQKPICLIKNELRSEIFDNTYKVVLYIASYVLNSKICYWGYNLAEIRSNTISISDINKAHIDRTMMMSISILEQPYDDILSAREHLCHDGVCNNKWQDMLLCIGNHEYASNAGISCLNSYDNCQSEVANRRFKCRS